MNIVFDNIIYSLQRYGGISVVWTNLISRILSKGDTAVSFIEYEDAKNNIARKTIDLPQGSVYHFSLFGIRFFRYLNTSLRKEMDVLKQDKFIFHSSYYRLCKDKNAINVTTVHDFSYKFFVTNPLVREINCRQIFNAIRESDHVVCISENTRKDLFRLLPDVPEQKVSVIYNGVDGRFFQLEGVQKKDFVLYVGKRDRYKNFEALIEPIAELGCKLKIVGPSLSTKEIDQMKRYHLDYEYCGVCSDSELNLLYNEAFCLLYTSLYEGFGLPVLEAQMAGCPVIAFNSSSIPEVIGDDRMLIDSFSVREFQERFDILHNPIERRKIISAGIDNAKRFSWEKMANEYHALYLSLLNR